MALLLDTHFTYWLTMQPDQLTHVEQVVIERHSKELCASAASLWELKLKWLSRYASGDRKFAIDPAEILGILQDVKIPVLPITADHAVAMLKMPTHHKDPFDMLLLLQAQEEGMQLLTRDIELLKHPLAYKFDD
jgi:PIN domain nuclease of toxin-antitoxin system